MRQNRGRNVSICSLSFPYEKPFAIRQRFCKIDGIENTIMTNCVSLTYIVSSCVSRGRLKFLIRSTNGFTRRSRSPCCRTSFTDLKVPLLSSGNQFRFYVPAHKFTLIVTILNCIECTEPHE